MSHRELIPYYLSISHSLSSILCKRQGGDWRKKSSLDPIPNPQQALQHMNGGGPVAAFSLSYSEGLFNLCYSSGSGDRSSGEELVYVNSRKRHSATTVCLLCALCALESRVTLPKKR